MLLQIKLIIIFLSFCFSQAQAANFFAAHTQEHSQHTKQSLRSVTTESLADRNNRNYSSIFSSHRFYALFSNSHQKPAPKSKFKSRLTIKRLNKLTSNEFIKPVLIQRNIQFKSTNNETKYKKIKTPQTDSFPEELTISRHKMLRAIAPRT